MKTHPLTQDGTILGYIIECPACECSHCFLTGKWSFNGDMNRPTFSPSMLVRGKNYPSGGQWPTEDEVERMKKGEQLQMTNTVCHSFVTDGKIQFLNDCTHKLKGQTIELGDW